MPFSLSLVDDKTGRIVFKAPVSDEHVRTAANFLANKVVGDGRAVQAIRVLYQFFRGVNLEPPPSPPEPPKRRVRRKR